MSKHLVAVGSNQVQSLLETKRNNVVWKQGEREVKGKEKLRAS